MTIAQNEFDTFLTDESALETRRQALIAELLKQREAFNKQIDERLARLGYKDRSGANAPKRGRPKDRGRRRRRHSNRRPEGEGA